MEWLSKIDAILESSLFASRADEDDDSSENEIITDSEEQFRNHPIQFEYMTVEDTVDGSNSVTQSEKDPVINHKEDGTELTFTQQMKEEIRGSQLPGTLRPVLRTRGSDSSDSSDDSEEEDDDEILQHVEENDRGNTPSMIETTIQGHVSPISSPRKEHGKSILLGASATSTMTAAISDLHPPRLDSFWNTIIGNSTHEMQLSEEEGHTFDDEEKIPREADEVHSNYKEEIQKFVCTEVNDSEPIFQSSPLELETNRLSSTISPKRTEPFQKQREIDNSSPTLDQSKLKDLGDLFQMKTNIAMDKDDTESNDDDESLRQPNTIDDMNPPLVIKTVQPMNTSQNTPVTPALDQIISASSNVDDRKTSTLNRKSDDVRAAFGDFLPSYIYDEEDDGSSDMTASEGQDYEYFPLVPWEQEESGHPFLDSMNCHGVIHVRLLRMQNLPCSTGANIQAVVSLPPWKGKIRFQSATTYHGPSKAGVCVRWDKRVTQEDDLSLDEEDVHTHCVSMVHTYNDEDTPVPEILIEIKDVAIKMFETDMCWIRLSCAPLMSQPGIFRRRWCVMHSAKNSGTKEETTDHVPMILLEASFDPTEFGTRKSIPSSSDVVLIPEPGLMSAHENGDFRSRCNTSETNDHSSLAQSSVRTKSSLLTKKLSSKPHMFRNYTMMRPTSCALCDKLIIWKLKGYQCEVCGLDCCSDCQLRIDVEIPCGSRKAQMKVENSLRSKLTLSKVYDMIAPPKAAPSITEEKHEKDLLEQSQSDECLWREGVGTMHLKINQGCIYSENFPPEAEIKQILESGDRWLRKGDYYCRVSWTGSTSTKRTKVVFQTSKPKFDSDEMSITASHYGTEYKIEVVDASSDKTIGTKLLTTQGLLQWSRDILAQRRELTWETIFKQRPLNLEKKTAILELRTGVKTGFGLDFYSNNKNGDGHRAGEICGWIQVDIGFEEAFDLYSNRPRPVPPRPNDDFDIDLIQLHIARVTSLLEDLTELLENFNYVLSWKNPALTSMSMFLFTTICLRFNTEKVGSLPILFIILYMILCVGKRRQSGGYRLKLLQKEKDARLKELKDVSVTYKKHRPIANLEMTVLKGKNLVPHHGIPGSLVTTVTWDPLKFADSDTKDEIHKYDPTSKCTCLLGETEGSAVTANPEWGRFTCSNDLKRLMQLLPSKNFLSLERSSSNLDQLDTDKYKSLGASTFQFPILQPIALSRVNSLAAIDDQENEEVADEFIQLLPWESSKAAIVVQIAFADVLNKLPIFDQILGHVVIPISHLAKESNIEGWFEVMDKERSDMISASDSDKEGEDGGTTSFFSRLTGTFDDGDVDELGNVGEKSEEKISRPKIYLKACLKTPDHEIPNDIDRETSIVIAEHFIKTAMIQNEEKGPGFIGSSINTFNTMTGVRSNIQSLQNQLSTVLDIIDKFRNLFNFTCPEKSAFVLLCLSILWFILLLIPTRWIIFAAGNTLFVMNFMSLYYPQPSSIVQATNESSKKEENYDPYVTRIINFFQGIPTDEDLRRYYFWEAIKVGEQEREILATKKRTSRLKTLWKAQWFGNIELKVRNYSAGSDARRNWDWKPIFAIVQGHRFIWWLSEKDFDEGENPQGQIFFAGHSGLAGLSPLELRELEKNEIPLVVTLFGRDAMKTGQVQTKISILCHDIASKDVLERAVIDACSDDKNQ